MKEPLKRATKWSAYYFTYSYSYYPVSETKVPLRDIPKIKRLPVRDMYRQDQDYMRQWASEHGKFVRQLSVCQRNTKHAAGTLPLNMYRKELPVGDRVTEEPSSADDIGDQLSEYHSDWVIPEKIHTPTTDEILEILAGGGGQRPWKSRRKGGLNLKKSSAGVISTNSSRDSSVWFSDTLELSDPENSRNILFTYFSPDINDNLSLFASPFISENANKILKKEPSQGCCNEEFEMPDIFLLVPRPSTRTVE